MNDTPETLATEAEAADWLVRLDADDSSITRAEFQRWLVADARRRATYIRLEQIWRHADRLQNLRPLDGKVDAAVLDTFPGARGPSTADLQRRPEMMYRAGLGVLALFIIVLAHWSKFVQPEWQVYRTGLGGFQRVILPDGTTALINTDSEIRVRMMAKHRQIVLARGEALFNVAHDRQRPFDVTAGDAVVRAVGTSFVVRLRAPRQVEVLVAEGRVAIDSQAPPTTLSAGQAVLIQDKRLDVEPLAAADVPHKLAWTQGRIWFRQNTLAEAVAEFNRYNRRQLVIADPAIANLRIGGAFEATDPEAFVAALGRVFPVRAVPGPGNDPQSDVIRLSGAE